MSGIINIQPPEPIFGKTHKRDFRKKHTKVIIVILIFISLIAMTLAVMYKVGVFEKKVAVDNKQAISIAEKKVAQLDSQVGIDPSKEKLNNTQAELAKLVSDNANNDVKQLYLEKSIELYINNNDFKSALTTAEQSEKINPTALTAADIAASYVGLGDYKMAAQYYQTAADRSTKTDNPLANMPYNDYMSLKREAEAKIK